MAALALAVLAWRGDAWLADSASAQVVAEVAAAETDVAQAQARIAGMVAYAWPVLTSADVDPAVRADLEGLVSQAAGQAVAPLAERGASLASVRVLPWHGDVRAAQEAALAYVQARVVELQDVAADAGARALLRPEIDTARARLRAALLALDPGSRGQIDAILPSR